MLSETEELELLTLRRKKAAAQGVVAQPASLKSRAEPYVRPVLEIGGAVGGGALATAAGSPLATAVGGALGYAGGKSLADILFDKGPQNMDEVPQKTAENLLEGGKMEALGIALHPIVRGMARFGAAGGKKLIGHVFNLSDEAVNAYLQDPASLKAATMEGLAQKLPKVADKFNRVIEFFSNQASEHLSTSKFLEASANDKGGAFVKDDVLKVVANARKALGGLYTDESRTAAKTLQRLSDALTKKRSTISQNEVHTLIQQLDEEIPWAKVWKAPETLTAADNALIKTRTAWDAMLKKANQLYADATKPVSEALGTRNEFLKKFDLKNVKGVGVVPSDATTGKLANSMKDGKLDTERILEAVKKITGEDIAPEVTKAGYNKEFFGERKGASRILDLATMFGTGTGAAVGGVPGAVGGGILGKIASNALEKRGGTMGAKVLDVLSKVPKEQALEILQDPILRRVIGTMGVDATGNSKTQAENLLRMIQEDPAKKKEFEAALSNEPPTSSITTPEESTSARRQTAMLDKAMSFGPGAMATVAGEKAAGFAAAKGAGKVFKGAIDKLPRFEIMDKMSKVTPLLREATQAGVKSDHVLQDLLEHSPLYKEYPKLKEMAVKLRFDNSWMARLGGVHGRFDPKTNTIEIVNMPKSPKAARRILLHETQHAIQEVEGFAPGGAPQQFALAKKHRARLEDQRKQLLHMLDQGEALGDLQDPKITKRIMANLDDIDARIAQSENPWRSYNRISGEAEARNVERRAGWSQGKLDAKPFNTTFDVPVEKQILTTRSGRTMQASAQAPLTSKLIEHLSGKGEVSKQFVEDAMRMQGVKGYEIELAKQALKDKGAIVNAADIANEMRQQLLPLRRTGAGTRYAAVNVPQKERMPTQRYEDHIYESPIKTSAGDTHFSTHYNDTSAPPEDVADRSSKNYFAHTRIQDLKDNATRQVLEVQSDLFQKGNLEHETLGNEVGNPNAKADLNAFKRLKPFENTWHTRIIREEVAQAAKDGKKFLQFPTGKTAMKIEGLGEQGRWRNGADSEILQDKHLKVGKHVFNEDDSDPWIITDVLGEGKFKAVPSDVWENHRSGSGYTTNMDSAKESFDITGKIDSKNPIFKFYETDIQKFLKNNYPDMQRIKDQKGIEWFQVPIKKEYGKQPILNMGALPKKPQQSAAA